MTKGVPALSAGDDAPVELHSAPFLAVLEAGRAAGHLSLATVVRALKDVELTPRFIAAVEETIRREGIVFDGPDGDLRAGGWFRAAVGESPPSISPPA